MGCRKMRTHRELCCRCVVSVLLSHSHYLNCFRARCVYPFSIVFLPIFTICGAQPVLRCVLVFLGLCLLYADGILCCSWKRRCPRPRCPRCPLTSPKSSRPCRRCGFARVFLCRCNDLLWFGVPMFIAFLSKFAF